MFKIMTKKIFNQIPARSNMLYRLAQLYIDRYNGDNNSDPSTNGEENFLERVLPKMRGGVVFDVGANVGKWAKYCISVEPSLQIHLFEPSKDTYEKLSAAKWPSNIKLNNFGLGERNECLKLNIVGSASGMNSIHKRHGVKGAEVKSVESVQLRTLDEYCEENNIEKIDFLKADVEGHELAVFKGAERMLEQGAIDLIQFEYGGCNLDARVYLLDIWEQLSTHKYRIAKIYPKFVWPLDKYSQSFETFRYANFVAYLKKSKIKNLIEKE